MMKKIPNLNISYSDHEAIYAKLRIKSGKSRSKKEYCQLDKNCVQQNEEHKLNLLEGITLCQNSLKLLDSHRNSYSLMALGVATVLFMVMDFNPIYGLKSAFLLLKFMMCGLSLFYIFMSTLWNSMEKNATLASKLSMEVALKRLDFQQLN